MDISTRMRNLKKNNFLFVSPRCNHCRKLLENIGDLIDCFTIIDIDNPKIKLPNYIEFVPTFVMQNEGKIMVNDELYSTINFLLGGLRGSVKQTQTQQQPQQSERPTHLASQMGGRDNTRPVDYGYGSITGRADIMPIDDSINPAFSDKYSVLIGEDINDNFKGDTKNTTNEYALKKSFAFLNDNDNNNNIPFIPPNKQISMTDNKKKKDNGDNDKLLEDLMKQRKLDEQRI